jgi:hypothetical protein
VGQYRGSTRDQGTRCTIESHGKFCDAVSAPGAPFPICAPHARKLYTWMADMVSEARRRPHSRLHVDVVSAYAAEDHAKRNTPDHRVYYVQIGKLIKIGTTTNLKQRLNAYPPGSQLLAAELGGQAREAQRHREFSHLLASRKEWFHPGPDLMAHIDALSEDRMPG